MLGCSGMWYEVLCVVLGYAVVHSVVFLSVFDVYYTTPVVSNIPALEWSNDTASQRLVLFVADGLRADKFFELDNSNKTRAPFLRQIILHNGTWGVSHARPPTESRPEHVAMLGGFYEDPSALTMFWKDNPVEFDTVLNRSRETWAWGAPDVLIYFNKGSSEVRVHIDCHNYGEGILSRLDTWVFDKVKYFFHKAQSDEGLHSRLMQNKLVFFLHLAGIDSNGHRHKPGSRQYLENIRVVDSGIKETVSLFEDFYKDKKTAYIFTADHGMTDEGGHGGGHETEVLTPFIAWGAGVDHFEGNENKYTLPEHEVRKTREWGLDPNSRVDLSQIDINILMAAIIGVPFPVNSDGKLPLTYLGINKAKMTEQVFGRAKQMAEQYVAKREFVKQKLFYIYFQEYKHNEKIILQKMIQNIDKSISYKKYDDAIAESNKLFYFTIAGVHYYKHYHRAFIYTSVVLTLISSITFALISVIKQLYRVEITRNSKQKVCDTKIGMIFSIVFLTLSLRLIVFQASWQYYFYCFTPVLCWFVVLRQITFIKIKDLIVLDIVNVGKVLTWIVFLCAIILGFYNRIFFILASTVICIIVTISFDTKTRFLKIIWTLLCICFTVFPLQTEILNESNKKYLVLTGGICASIFCGCLHFYHNNSKTASLYNVISFCTILLPSITGFIGYIAPHSSVLFGRTVIILSWIVPFLTKPNLYNRLMCVYAWHLSSYTILSHSYEALYYVNLTALLHVWLLMEVDKPNTMTKLPLKSKEINEKNEPGNSVSRSTDSDVLSAIRRGGMLIYFLSMGFFGLFTIESLNHFHVRRLPFLPITNTFTIMVLSFYKLAIHYVTISVCFCGILKLLKTSFLQYWYITVIFCDLMSICFYLQVQDSGSWAEMAFSIVRLGIPLLLPLGVLLLMLLGKLLLSIKVMKRCQFC